MIELVLLLARLIFVRMVVPSPCAFLVEDHLKKTAFETNAKTRKLKLFLILCQSISGSLFQMIDGILSIFYGTLFKYQTQNLNFKYHRCCIYSKMFRFSNQI